MVTRTREDQKQIPVSSVQKPRPPQGGEPAGLQSALIEPYEPFDGGPFDDPRSAETTDVARCLVEIIALEGPMIANRAYDTYLRAAGIQRMGKDIKKLMNRAMSFAIKKQWVISVDELARGACLQSTVRGLKAPEVRLRTMGPRSINQVPPSEVKAMAEHVRQIQPGLPRGGEEHMRAMLDAWGVKRLTSNSRVILTKAFSPER